MKIFFIGLLVFYVFVNGVAFIIGIQDAAYNGWKCAVVSRIERIFPGHRFGCYMGEVDEVPK